VVNLNKSAKHKLLLYFSIKIISANKHRYTLFAASRSKRKTKRKLLLFPFFLTIVIIGLSFGGILRFGVAEAGTTVGGLITSDTTWIKANSPYILTGAMAVNTGVTLAVEAGTLVNLNNFYIQVNGTLIANGSDTDKITFNNGQITFTPLSNGWNETTGSGCIIENAILNGVEISSSNPLKISNSTSNLPITVGNSSIISYNNIAIVPGWGLIIAGNSSIISYNNLTGLVGLNAGDTSIVTNNTVNGAITCGERSTVANNTITGGRSATGGGRMQVGKGSLVSNNYVWSELSFEESTLFNNTVNGWLYGAGSSTISYNKFIGAAIVYLLWGGGDFVFTHNAIDSWYPSCHIQINGDSVVASHNIISGGGGYGLDVSAPNFTISDNTISQASTGIYASGGSSTTAIIERNIIASGGTGIELSASNATVVNNTIVSNDVGFSIVGGAMSTITNNTIASNNVGIIDGGSLTTITNNIIAFNNEGIRGGATSTIVNNIIVSNNVAIRLDAGITPPVVNNTFAFNNIGIKLGSSSPNIYYNNFQNTSEYNIYLSSGATGNVNVTNNWWGTTDTQAINQSMYDFKNDFNLGTVNFIPFLTEPNPAAPTIPMFNILASAGTGGSINPSGSVSVSYGGNQTFNITADTGYYIADVTVDGSSVGAVSSYNFINVQADHTISATFAPTPTPSPSPSSTPTPTASPTPTPSLSPSPSPSPTATPTPTPTPTPSPSPTTAPTPSPTVTPSPEPTATPSPLSQPDTGIYLPIIYILAIAVIALTVIIAALIIKIKKISEMLTKQT
jgi:parallel beta-helix repeat protein